MLGWHGVQRDLVRDGLAIEREREGLAHAHIVEGRMFRVDRRKVMRKAVESAGRRPHCNVRAVCHAASPR